MECQVLGQKHTQTVNPTSTGNYVLLQGCLPGYGDPGPRGDLAIKNDLQAHVRRHRSVGVVVGRSWDENPRVGTARTSSLSQQRQEWGVCLPSLPWCPGWQPQGHPQAAPLSSPFPSSARLGENDSGGFPVQRSQRAIILSPTGTYEETEAREGTGWNHGFQNFVLQFSGTSIQRKLSKKHKHIGGDGHHGLPSCGAPGEATWSPFKIQT